VTTVLKLKKLDSTKQLLAADFQMRFRKVDKLILLMARFKARMQEKVLNGQLQSIRYLYKMLTGEAAPETLKGEWNEEYDGGAVSEADM